jgi:hypothetical protein
MSAQPFQATEVADLIDLYVDCREARLALERRAEEQKKQETWLKEQIEKTLAANKLTVGGSAKWKATLKSKDKPIVADWSLLYSHIKETDGFDLLQRRLTEAAVKLRWDEALIVPGVERFPITEVSITKV